MLVSFVAMKGASQGCVVSLGCLQERKGTWVSLCHWVERRETQGFTAAVNELGHLLVSWCGTNTEGAPLCLCWASHSLNFGRENKLFFLVLSMPIGGSELQATLASTQFMGDEKKTQETHHIVVHQVLRSLISSPCSFQLSESFYHCILNKIPRSFFYI